MLAEREDWTIVGSWSSRQYAAHHEQADVRPDWPPAAQSLPIGNARCILNMDARRPAILDLISAIDGPVKRKLVKSTFLRLATTPQDKPTRVERLKHLPFS